MTTEDDSADDRLFIGDQVASLRKLAGLTQRQLGVKAHVSPTLISQVERGRTPASPAFVASVARALHLSGQDLIAPPGPIEDANEYRLRAVIAPLRRELLMYQRPPTDEDVATGRSLDELATAVAQLSARRQEADLLTLGEELPPVMAELRTAVHTSTGSDAERAFGLRAEAYAAAGQVLYKLGWADLSSLTTERVEWAAALSGDELAVSAADFYRAGEIIGVADWDAASRYLEDARRRIEHRRKSDDEPGLSMWGQLHLKSGLAAARAGKRDDADAHLAEAGDVAKRVTPGRDFYRLAFDTDSVNIWSVGLAVEALDGAKAIKRSEKIPPFSTAPRERIGHHFIDTARAYLLQGDREKSFSALMKARRVSPQQTRHHPGVHETIRVMAANDRRSNHTLAGYARWAGVRLGV